MEETIKECFLLVLRPELVSDVVFRFNVFLTNVSYNLVVLFNAGLGFF